MSSSNQTLIVNCGASHVSASVFNLSGSQITLEQVAIESLNYDYSSEEGWLRSLGIGLRSVLSKIKGPKSARIIAPGYQLLTKTIKVPHVEKGKQAQIIAFETQQNIPYPLGDVVWDYQVIADDGVETEVLIIAVKSEVIGSFCQQIAQAGLVSTSIQASSILDYNAYRYNYGDIAEDTLVINIGSRSSNLLFISKAGFFIRNISIGGNTLTQSLADSLGKPFAEAEKVKVAYFSGETSFESGHPSVQIFQTTAESFQKRLSQEITRSIVTYRRQKGAAAPTKILLTGKGALLPGLSEFLSEAQKVSVDYFDPLANVQIGKGVDLSTLEIDKYSMSEVVGEAARSVLSDAVSIDLLPPEIAFDMAFAKKKPILLAAAALLAVSFVPAWLMYHSGIEEYRQVSQQIESAANPYNNLHRQIVENRKSAEAIRARISSLEKLVNSKSNWIIFFSDLQTRLTEVGDVWLEDLKLDRSTGNRLNVSGRLLIRDYNPDNPAQSAEAASIRVRTLLDTFRESDFIQTATNLQFDSSNPRILGFRFDLALNPERPL